MKLRGELEPHIPVRDKPVIFITSRVHPGESNASWMMKGILDMLLNPQSEDE